MIFCGLMGTQAQSQKLTLDDSEDLVEVINAAAEAGGTYDVTFSPRAINLDSWNVWCLPFDIRPVEFTKVLGSIVVDLLIEGNDDGHVHFEPSVSGVIPAGTPFLINVGKMKRTPTDFSKVTFKGVTLKKVKPQHTVSDACGNRFISTFSPVEVYGRKIWYMSKGGWYDARKFTAKKPVSLKPLRCYVDFSGNTAKVRPQIIIREPDGTTTTIDEDTFNEGEFSTEAGILADETQKLTLDDGEDLVPVINAAAEAGGTYDVTFSSRPVVTDNWDVLCLPFDITPAEISKVLGYVAVARLIEKNADGDIRFEPTVSGVIPAGTPFVINVGKLKRTPTDYKKVTFKDVTLKQVEPSYSVTDAGGNRFISTFSPVELTDGHLWYMSESEWWSVGEPVTLKPLRCYIDVSGNTLTENPQIFIDDSAGETAIFTVKAFNEGSFGTKGGMSNGWFTLTGTRLTEAPAAKGIYIHQGRKVVIR